MILFLAYGNLRGVREAGRLFALPAYLFMAAVGLVLAVSAVRGLTGGLPRADLHAAGVIPVGTPGHGWLYGASLFIVLRAFANGGSSLTGLEAISNGVSAFREPQGRNARRTLITMSCVLGILVLGVSTLARFTHAVPYRDGTPTVIAQEAHFAFGGGVLGTAGLVFVQLATALVLYTGANTPFTGFPYLASFVAEDRFLPRQLTRRGHRLAFSNGIIALTVVAMALLLVTRASVDKLVALYAIGVFTAFTMAGAGLTAYHWRRRERHRRLKIGINALAAVVSATVVLIFAVTKFTEGAWLVVVVFPLGVWALTRINREYRSEAAVLGTIQLSGADRPRNRRHLVFVLVETLDLATVKALRYAHEVRPDEIRAVHFAIDEAHGAQALGVLGGDGRDLGAAGAGGVPRPTAAARHGGTGRAHHRGRRDLADRPGPPAPVLQRAGQAAAPGHRRGDGEGPGAPSLGRGDDPALRRVPRAAPPGGRPGPSAGLTSARAVDG